MSAKSSQPIPLTIIAGFLGAGKTTLLNHILHATHGLRIAVLVNDFGAINIDAQLIVGVQGETVSLSNGCICCTIRDDLLKETLRLIEQPNPPDYIIVETSGVSDPLSVVQTFNLPQLRSTIQIDSIITIVDAEQLTTLKRKHALLALDQLTVADIIVINKVDRVTQVQLVKLKKDWLYHQARTIETTYGRVSLELVLGISAYAPARLLDKTPVDVHIHDANQPQQLALEHAHMDHLIFDSWTWTTPQALSFKALEKTVKALPSTIFRAKGIIHLADSPDKRGILQMVGTRISLALGEAWKDQIPYTQLIVIGTSGGVDADALQRQFDGCIVGKGQRVRRLVNTVTEWLRG